MKNIIIVVVVVVVVVVRRRRRRRRQQQQQQESIQLVHIPPLHNYHFNLLVFEVLPTTLDTQPFAVCVHYTFVMTLMTLFIIHLELTCDVTR